MDMNKKEKNKCVECGYITTDRMVGNFICKDCLKNIKKPTPIWLILIMGIGIMITLHYYEAQTINFLLGLCVGALLVLSIRINKENNNGNK